MRLIGKMLGLLVMASVVIVLIQGTASAREVITLTKANGGSYSVMAYNTSTKSYYYVNGDITSDSHPVTVPNGYGSTISVALGRAVGTRNMYEEKDPLSPILEVRKKSTYVLELIRTGTSPAVSSAPLGSGSGFFGPPPFERKPPQ